MKKIVILLAILLVFGHVAPLFAQQSSSGTEESEYYYFSVPIEKIFTHRLGYLIIYRRGSSNHMARTYIPHSWFSDSAGRGDVVGLGSGKEWPSMIVYYKNGEFSHVRLRIRKNRMHETWGVLPLNINVDEYFKDIEEIKLVF